MSWRHLSPSAEVQTLVCKSDGQDPSRRVTSGLDPARVGMVVAVARQRAHVDLARKDVYAATVGGVRLTEPSVDLAVALALAGAVADLSLPPDLVAFGEVGLAGEIRAVVGVGRRLAEAARMGFRRAIVPCGTGAFAADCPLQVSQVADLRTAITAGLGEHADQ